MSTESTNQTTSQEATAPTPNSPPRNSRAEIPEDDRRRIIELKNMGYGKRKISERLGLSSKKVAQVLREAGLLKPLVPPASTPSSKLEPFREEIAKRVAQRLKITRILREIKELGYTGSRTILAAYVRQIRPTLCLAPVNQAKVKRRFETQAGEEMQIDFSPFRVSIAGIVVLVHVFAALLCYSRRLYVRLFREERTSSVLEGLAGAFEYNRGCTQRVVMDNMVQAVLGRIGPKREVLWQPRLLECARYYCFEPVACAVRDPNRKGKDEKIFQLLLNDFFMGRSFESWENMERQFAIWLDQTPGVGNLRVHGTTRKVPNEVWENEERAFLIRLPDQPFAFHEASAREVDLDSTLSIRGTRYSVPASLAGRSVAVRLFAHHFEVLDAQQRVAFSRRYVPDSQKGSLVIDQSHYALLPRTPKGQSPGRMDDAFVKRFPALAPLVDGLKHRYKTLAPIQLRTLLRLADRYGHDAFLAAATRAQEYRRFDAGAIRRILEASGQLPNDADDSACLGGAGAALLGEAEPPSLDRHSCLDAVEASPEPTPSDSPKSASVEGDDGTRGGGHGA
jgi:transposase